MLILHAAQIEGSLVIWSEDSESRDTPPDRQLEGKHPYSAQAQVIAEAIGLETVDNSFGSAIAWLPSRGRRSRAFQPHGRPHAQIAGEAAHQAMDRGYVPTGT